MPCNVAFYSDALSTGRYGLGRYASQLLPALRRNGALSIRSISAHSGKGARLEEHTSLPFSRKIAAGVWSTIGWPGVERWAPEADIVHGVELDYQIPTRRPFVVTIHDIGPLTHPEYFRASHPWLLRRALSSVADRAAAILCVSGETADAVESYLCRDLGSRLRVIPEGVSEEFFHPAGEDVFVLTRALRQCQAPFFLCAGSFNPRKNLGRVVAAFERLADRIPHHLVLTGTSGWDDEKILARIGCSTVRNRIHLPGHVSDDELRGLYQAATAFLFPSLMEGFGLPILEAMAGGCPVITSNVSSMPEVAGDAALLVSPTSEEAIAAALEHFATDDSSRASYSRRSRARARQFSWSECAQAVAEVYLELAPRAAAATENVFFMKGREHAT